MISVELNEPRYARYIYINPETNRVHIMMPLVGGETIGTDNTCQTAKAMQEFLGYSGSGRGSAIIEIDSYINKLQQDLRFLSQDSKIYRLKSERLQQLEAYRQIIPNISVRHDYARLQGAFPEYPDSVKAIFRRRTNLTAMLLSPSVPDTLLRAGDYVFSLRRENLYDYTGPTGGFASLLRERLSGHLAIGQSPSIKQDIINRVVNSLGDVATINDIQIALTRACHAVLGAQAADLNFTKTQNNDDLDESCLTNLSLIDEDSTLEEKVNAVISSAISNDFWADKQATKFLPTCVNNASRENLSIMTQFFLGQINVHCFSEELSNHNFGQVLDETPAIANQICEVVINAIRDGDVVENALFNVINENRTHFRISRDLTTEDLAKIKELFNVNYETIKSSPHFDEFVVTAPGKAGEVVSHQSGITVDLANFLQRAHSALLPDILKPNATDIGDFTSPLPGTNEDAVGSEPISLQISDVYDRVLSMLNSSNTAGAAELLLSQVRGKGGTDSLYKHLDHSTIKLHYKWTDLYRELVANIQSDTERLALHDYFNIEVEQQVVLTLEMLRSMHCAAVCSVGPERAPCGYNTIADITRILEVLQIQNTDLVQHRHSSDFDVTTNTDGRRLIQHYVEQNRNRIHLSTNVAKALYVEVRRRYGIGSPQYQGMENLNNDPRPDKIRRALELLDIPIAEENIKFSNYDGYIAKFANNDQINTLQALEQQINLYHIPLEKEQIIYEKVTAAEMGDLLADLSNSPYPQKLVVALNLLGLGNTIISFHRTNGYLISATNIQKQILDNIENYNPSIVAGIGGGGSRTGLHSRQQAVSSAFESGALFAGRGGGREYRATAPAPTGQGDARTAVHDGTSPAPNIPRGGGPRLFTTQRPFASAGPSTHAAVDTGDFQVQRVAAFRSDSHAPLGDPSAVAIYCPQEVLNAFRGLMQGQLILGCSFRNPYTELMEQIPANAADLTARHLQILARNESQNTDGTMQTHLYCNLMDDNAIAGIRCLVKATTVAGKVSVARYGGYPANTITTDHPSGVEAIIVDQAGLQWQGDLRNTGGMLFYPDSMEATGVPAGYADWQNSMFFAMYGEERPANFSANVLETNWNGVRGHLDLDLVKKAITSEFRQALDSVVDQANANTPAGTRINFRFLKAGMGFFASGLHFPNGSDQQQRLALARMEGIRDALRQIQALDPAERSAVVGKIGRLEFPFSDGDVMAAGCITEIRNIVVGIGLEWGGAGNVDSTSPAPEGYINALTNCADPHAMPGNEGGYQSVDAAISTNARVDLLNVAYNERAQCKINSRPSVAHAAAITAVAAPATPLAEEGGVDLVAGLNLARQHCLHKILQQFAVDDMAPGQWFRLDQSVVEIRMDGWEFGRGRHTGLLAFSNGDYHLEFSADGNNVILLDKRAGFQEITGDQRQVILQTVYDNFPVEVVAPAAAVVMPVPEENADTYEAEIQQAKEHCLRNLGGELSRGTWICLDPDLFGFNLAEWEFGRGSSTNRVGIASASHHIDFMDDGSINVLDKNNNYAQITGAERTNILRTVANAFGDEMKAAPRTMSP